MKISPTILLCTIITLSITPPTHAIPPVPKKTITLTLPQKSTPRMKFGMEKLQQALSSAGFTIHVIESDKAPKHKNVIIAGRLEDPLVKNALTSLSIKPEAPQKAEGFSITSSKQTILIAGKDASGVLYGCLELAARITSAGTLPENIAVNDRPEMVLRGACIGLQKPVYLPGRGVYEYPYTPETFPWFYDKALWIQYLDMLVQNRMNSLYLWNGHPFASLVRLKEYPYAVEVDDATFRKNEEMFRFLTEEADRRGIWVIQMFYNIIVSKPFAEHHGLKTQDRERPIVPAIADYTRKSIAAFVQKYPNVGLLVTLGEAMRDEDDIAWFTRTIIPGVQDGMKALGKQEEPPIVLRAHDSDPEAIMQAALPQYKNLYTMAKYNGEALTSYTPRGPWAAMHRGLSRLGSVHVDNVHILANLEPFRYGSPAFIQKSVQAMHTAHGANGLHLYPQASYWDWPFTADNATPRLLQIDRDRLWYHAWARYSWNCHRSREEEIDHWSAMLAKHYGCDKQAGRHILEAYEQAGEIAPKLLRRFGITNGNRQTLTLGMTMSQLVNPHKYRVWKDLYDSDGPEGEMLIEYAAKEREGRSHTGETPVQIIEEVTMHGQRAVEAIERAAAGITKNGEEFARLKNDLYCHRALANFFEKKVRAALLVMKYRYTKEHTYLEEAYPHLAGSLGYFDTLTTLTKDTYLYANSMQTQQRKVPVGGDGGRYKTWVEMLPLYRQELENFKRNLDSLKANPGKREPVYTRAKLKNAPVRILSETGGRYRMQEGQTVFSGSDAAIEEYAAPLKDLEGIKFPEASQRAKGATVTFKCKEPVKIVVGYFNSDDPQYLQPPDLETDANANEYGQASVKIANALSITGHPPVNIHTYSFKPGTHTLNLRMGLCLVIGIIAAKEEIPAYDAGIGVKEKEIDWLFE